MKTIDNTIFGFNKISLLAIFTFCVWHSVKVMLLCQIRGARSPDFGMKYSWPFSSFFV